MHIWHQLERRRFVAVDEDGAQMGEMLYAVRPDGAVDVQHTFVPERYGGRGVAAKLLQTLAAWARESGSQVVPTCSYVARAFQKHPEQYEDVIYSKGE